jgi:hypothetical protein
VEEKHIQSITAIKLRSIAPRCWLLHYILWPPTALWTPWHPWSCKTSNLLLIWTRKNYNAPSCSRYPKELWPSSRTTSCSRTLWYYKETLAHHHPCSPRTLRHWKFDLTSQDT